MGHPIQKTATLGAILLRNGSITQHTLDAALEEQHMCGSRLGHILIGKGSLNNLKLYQAIAEHYNLPFADLRHTPADSSLLNAHDREDYLQLGVLPWKMHEGKCTYAVTDITPALLDWIQERGVPYSLAITSPVDIAYTIQQNFHHEDDEAAREILWKNTPENSAKTLLSGTRGKLTLLAAVTLFLLLLLQREYSLYLFVGMSLFYAVTLLFKMMLFAAGLRHTPPYPLIRENKNLPVYTILVPLYREAAILPQLVRSIRKLDYPKSKLDVKLVVEEGDTETIQAIKALQCESYFEIIPVPYSLPQTKPKACNYALKYAKGEYITIYDAEDIPYPLQLRQVLSVFHHQPDVVCVQAKLNYYNRRENLLSRMFSLEYGIWFDFLLHGLDVLKLPIPLGGTSNHIRRDVLQRLHAWDPYNVTEDADLGVRLAANGYKTRMVDSLTLEEAPVSPRAWIGQRSRWIKGYMQTYLVYMRHPFTLWQRLGSRGFIGFQLFIGAPCLIFLINPIMWGAWGYISLFGWHALYTFSPALGILFQFNLLMGIGLHFLLATSVVIRHRWWDMLPFILLFPLYWLLHSFASIKALWQLAVKPHWWEKTMHGLSKYTKPVDGAT